MLMTGADERGVSAIEKLTKQKFTPAAVQIERRERGERGERGERAERSERGERPARRDERYSRGHAPRPAAPVDDLFTKPYEPGTPAPTPAESAAPPSAMRRSPSKVAALLGGNKK